MAPVARPDRIVSLSNPEARPIRKGRAGKPTEFGHVAQICEFTPNTKPGGHRSRRDRAGQPGREHAAATDRDRDRESRLEAEGVAPTAASATIKSDEQLARLEPERIFVSGRRKSGLRRTKRHLRHNRTGTEGRISHLKRSYGLKRSRLKGSTRDSRSGAAGGSSPPTSTPLPSGRAENLIRAPRGAPLNCRSDSFSQPARSSPFWGLSGGRS